MNCKVEVIPQVSRISIIEMNKFNCFGTAGSEGRKTTSFPKAPSAPQARAVGEFVLPLFTSTAPAREATHENIEVGVQRKHSSRVVGKSDRKGHLHHFLGISGRISKLRKPPSSGWTRKQRKVHQRPSNVSSAASISQGNSLRTESNPFMKEFQKSGRILKELLRAENEMERADISKFEEQDQISSDVRATAVLWMIERQVDIKMPMPVLFHAVNIVDLLLCGVQVRKEELQSLCMAAMRIACEENSCILDDDEMNYTKKCSSKMLMHELKIRTTVSIGINSPTCMTFIPFLFRACNSVLCVVDDLHENLVDYILCLSLLRHESFHFKPSHTAAAAVNLASKTVHRLLDWDSTISVFLNGLLESHFEDCESYLKRLLKVTTKSSESKTEQCLRKIFPADVYEEMSQMLRTSFI